VSAVPTTTEQPTKEHLEARRAALLNRKAEMESFVAELPALLDAAREASVVRPTPKNTGKVQTLRAQGENAADEIEEIGASLLALDRLLADIYAREAAEKREALRIEAEKLAGREREALRAFGEQFVELHKVWVETLGPAIADVHNHWVSNQRPEGAPMHASVQTPITFGGAVKQFYGSAIDRSNARYPFAAEFVESLPADTPLPITLDGLNAAPGL
jgi:hypothetical protein